MKKFLVITVSAVAVIVIALIAFVKIYVTPEKVKGFIIPFAEQSLNRKINIGEINISLLKGIGLKDFAIKESDGKTDFVKCKDFVLKFKILPLLAKKVIVDELKVVSPEVYIRRDKDGRFNFEGIGEKKEHEGVKEEKTVREPGGLPVSLLVNRISIDNAGFSLTDLMNELPDIKSSADIDISIKSIDGSSLATGGDISLKLDELIMKKPSGKLIKNISAILKYAVRVDLESKDIQIDMADLKVQNISASIKGSVTNIETSPEVDIAVTLPKTNTVEIQKLAALFADLKGLSLSGDIAADIKVKGIPEKPDTLRTGGNVLLEKVGIRYQDMDASVDGSIKFNEKSINLNLKGTLDKNTVELKGTVRDYLKDQKINLNIYSRKLFLDEFIPAAESNEKPSARTGEPAPEKAIKEAEPVDLKLTANGEVKIDSAVYKGMLMSDFHMKYRFENNKLTISELTARAGKGKFSLNSFVDISKPGYRYNLSSTLDSLHADEVVNAFFPKAKDTVFGLLSFNLKLNGAGTLPKNIKKNIVADADFKVKDGKITNAKIAKNLSRLLDIKELETINMKQADGTVKIRNSIARLDSIILSDDLSMNPS
ncbi:MAG: AsmA family protein, partial [Thermodesulfovibrionia bacterium]|nr:AsmA family protein [Thermodesulfovibrionia bacterium]